jgi:RNA polymerase sigma-70 factor, ECF subfamily
MATLSSFGGNSKMQNIRSLVLKPTTRLRSGGVVKDEIIIAAIAAGDDGALRILYNRHHVHVFRFVARLVGDATAAEDIVSETFIDVWRHAGLFEGRSAVATWIMSIARFKVLSVRRRRQDVTLDEKFAEAVPDQACTPEEAMLDTDRSAQLRDCLTKLTAEHREIVDLVYYHGKTVEEVAEIIRVPRSTVKTRMFYARKRLRQLLDHHGDFERGTSSQGA